jgi:hypothetical protein
LGSDVIAGREKLFHAISFAEAAGAAATGMQLRTISG